MATLLRRGSRGSEVKTLQEQLKAAGFDPGPLDGIFGPKTLAAVKAFQTDRGLQVDGIAGPKTAAALTADESSSTETEETPEADDPIPKDDVEQPTGDYPGVLSGGQLIPIQREGQEDIYVMAYEWPAGSGKYVTWQFDNLDQVAATFGDDWKTSGKVSIGEPRDESWIRSNATDAGTVDEIIGIPGSFSGMIDDVVYDASQAAGISDPTVLGKMLNDPEIQGILVKSSLEGWTDQQYKAALRGTGYWKNTLYPGIEKLYGMTDRPEDAYKQYIANIAPSLDRMGVPKDADGSYKSTAKTLLLSGVSDTALSDNAKTYIRAQNSTDYAESLNKWTTRLLGKSFSSFDEWFDVLAGDSPSDIQEVVEVATLNYVSNNKGSTVSDGMLREVGQKTDLSEEQMGQLFSDYERSLLALGDRGLGRYGLTTQDILAAKAGYQRDSQGRPVTRTNQLVKKAAKEEGLMDDNKAQFYASFNERGSLVKPGLGAIAPEAG